ncbi:site-2 protease family protein [Hyalangium rubrum]|uniref:Site-2 protease family protein n=1 Tax=Hyalangium rubrum TaxID=3103134 RepID=A0ABU5H378_9BACT|nr:site-2 protease family protein [Hyalangium sp. s54d21]MDY7227731.1 site-2 protease family protein [Hyalangium sp. s54d21]
MEIAPARPAVRLWPHLLLFVLTVGTTLSAYPVSFVGVFPWDALGISRVWNDALAFSLALLTILGSHEMGHYLLARYHKVDATLPYFIPLPIIGVGTLGAVIRIRGRIPHRNALVDIGASGPLAGLIVAIPILIWGLLHSQVVDAPQTAVAFPGEDSLVSLLQRLFAWTMEQLTQVAPAAATEVYVPRATIFADNLLMQGLTYLTLGPLPEGKDVAVHPVVISGWFGLLVTLLNLLPVGQLDGGHLAYALWGRRAQWVGKTAALVLLGLTLFATASWGVWLLVVSKMVGFGHPEVVEPEVPLSTGRKWVCALCFLALIACAMPIPLRQV